jgi:hypothetical protein
MADNEQKQTKQAEYRDSQLYSDTGDLLEECAHRILSSRLASILSGAICTETEALEAIFEAQKLILKLYYKALRDERT